MTALRAPLGTFTRSFVAETTVTLVALVVPNFTTMAGLVTKLRPVMVTMVPTLPRIGDTAVIFGARWVTLTVTFFAAMVPEPARTVVAPKATPVTRPVAPTLATFRLPVDHWTVDDTVRAEPSEKVPVATYCFVRPGTTVDVDGVTTSDRSTGAVTVRVAVPNVPAKVAEMPAAPGAAPCARPCASTVAADVLDDHVAAFVTSVGLPALQVAVAVNCRASPLGTLVDNGLTVTAVTTGAVTVTSECDDNAPMVDVTVASPWPAPVTRPKLSTVAVDGAPDCQVTVCVRFWVLASENVPIAVSWVGRPWATRSDTGVTLIDRRTAGVTVSVALPLTPPTVAVMVDVPVPTAPAVAPLIVATAVLPDDQVACDVTSVTAPSDELADAVNGWVSPFGTLGVAGLTAMLVITAGVTVTVVLERKAPVLAEIVAEPTAFAVTKPWVSTSAVEGASLAQVTVSETSGWLPSENVPVAVSLVDWPLPTLTDGAGVTASARSTAGVTVSAVVPSTPWKAAVIVVTPWAFVVATPPVTVTVATDVAEDDHVAREVTSAVLPSS